MEAIVWLIIVAVLVIVELATMALTTIWFAAGAVVAFIAALLGASIVVQAVLFLIVSVLMLAFTRPVITKYFNKNTYKSNAEGLIGQTAKVTQDIDNINGTGTAVINGMEWMARTQTDGEIIKKDENVQVVEISGVKLIVTRK